MISKEDFKEVYRRRTDWLKHNGFVPVDYSSSCTDFKNYKEGIMVTIANADDYDYGFTEYYTASLEKGEMNVRARTKVIKAFTAIDHDMAIERIMKGDYGRF